MRVLHVHRIGGIGGSERHLLTLLPALSARGVDTQFLGLDDPSRAPDPFYEQLNVPYTRLPAPRDLDPMLAGRTLRAVRSARPDIVHTHLVHADVYGALAGGRLVSTKHNDDPFRAGPFRYVERALAWRADQIVAITDALARFQIERVGIPASKLVTIHYGLDTPPEPWGPNPPDDVPRDASVLLAVCRLEHQKGIDLAVRALARVRERHPEVVLVVLGEGAERHRLAELARTLGAPVYLLGRVPDVAAWLRRASVLVHPVRWEGFGLAVLEAMLAGLPVVATRVSSLPELVAHGETGVLVPPEDNAALATGIERALEAEPRLGEAGRRRAQECFSVARMADATLDVYRRVLDGRNLVPRAPMPTVQHGPGPGGWTENAYADAAAYLAHRAELVVGLGPPIEAGDTVIDLACGDGALADFLPGDVGYIGVDGSAAMVAAARAQGRDVLPGDLNEWEPLEPVDVTTCFRAIYYARDRRAFFERVAHYTNKKLVFDLNPRQYRLDDIRADLTHAGFARLDVRPFFSPQTVALPRTLARILRALERTGPLARLLLRVRFSYVCAASRRGPSDRAVSRSRPSSISR